MTFVLPILILDVVPLAQGHPIQPLILMKIVMKYNVKEELYRLIFIFLMNNHSLTLLTPVVEVAARLNSMEKTAPVITHKTLTALRFLAQVPV